MNWAYAKYLRYLKLLIRNLTRISLQNDFIELLNPLNKIFHVKYNPNYSAVYTYDFISTGNIKLSLVDTGRSYLKSSLLESASTAIIDARIPSIPICW